MNATDTARLKTRSLVGHNNCGMHLIHACSYVETTRFWKVALMIKLENVFDDFCVVNLEINEMI